MEEQVQKRGRGRLAGYSHSERVRQRIKATQLMHRLEKHALGEIEMTLSQIRAAEILLRKVVPDLRQVEIRGSIEHRHVTELTDAELLDIIAGRGLGTPAETGGPVLN